MGIHLGACNEVFDTLLLAVSLFAFLFWLLLPRGMWEGWLCGYGMLGASLLAFTLWRTSRELRMRVAFERVASELSEENASLKASSAQLKGDPVMLRDTIGALGDRGADWLGQLPRRSANRRDVCIYIMPLVDTSVEKSLNPPCRPPWATDAAKAARTLCSQTTPIARYRRRGVTLAPQRSPVPSAPSHSTSLQSLSPLSVSPSPLFIYHYHLTLSAPLLQSTVVSPLRDELM